MEAASSLKLQNNSNNSSRPLQLEEGSRLRLQHPRALLQRLQQRANRVQLPRQVRLPPQLETQTRTQSRLCSCTLPPSCAR